MTENQEKARTSVKNVTSAWSRTIQHKEKIKGEVVSYKNYVLGVANTKPKGKPKKHYKFGTTEYNRPRIL